MKHNPAAFLFLLAVLLCFSAIHSAFGAAGDLDTAYNPNPGNYVFSAAVQPDGKLVIGGDFGNIGASARSHIARLDAAGAVDAGFNPGANGSVRSLVVQADGRIIVGGSFTTIAGTSRSWLARLNADGTLDTTFANTNVTGTGDISDGLIGIALQADGKILLCGQFTTVGGVARNNIARLNADGTLDTSFNPNANKMVTSMAVRSDGKIAIGGYFTQVAGASSGNIFGDGLAVLNASGTISQIYDVDGPVWSLAVQSDGKVLFGGWFTKVNSVARNRLGRLNADGSLDGAFVPAILLTPYYEGVDGIVVQANGQMIVCGSFTAVGGVTRNHIARLNADATLDAALNPNLTGSPAGGALQADGKFILVSSVGSVGGVARNWMARLLNDAPTESLAATSASRVQWLRGGAAPEAYAVTFELSTDGGATWTPLGGGTRITGGWEATGLSLPGSGKIRARARCLGGGHGGSVSLLETVANLIFAPVVASPTSSGIATTSATLGGNVTSDGNATITARGVVISDTATNGSPTIGGTGVTNITTTGTTGVFTVNAGGLTQGTQYSYAAYATNSVGTTYTSPVSTFTTLAPDIAMEQPAGTGIADGGSQGFGNVIVGNSASLTFTIRNPGTASLTGLGITFDGTDAAQFSVTASPVAPVATGGSTTFTVQFAPTAPGTKSAVLHIASNVSGAKNPYDISLSGFAYTGPSLAGTKTVGPSGTYPSIGAAIADIQLSTLGGALVLELQPGYASTAETFPLTFANLGTTAVNTLTVRPAAGAAGRTITSADTTAATVDLNGAKFVTLDGRPGGAGMAKQLTIANTSTSGVAVRFINEASGNTVKYVTLQGVNTSATSGTAVFSTTTGANGNDSNTIDNCDIRDGATTPANALYSLGSTGSTAQNNSGNTISNCNVFNFYPISAAESAGLRLDGGNTDWTITGNSFYQTAARAGVTATLRAINVNNSSGNSFIITGNFIGGSASGAGGSAWPNTTSTFPFLFQGIRLNAGTATPSSVQGNAIGNIVWSSTSAGSFPPGIWSGIYVQAGSVNIGTTTGNTIGSSTGTGSVTTTSGSSATTFGIGSSSGGTVVIGNNIIGSITANGTGTNVTGSLTAIQVTAGTNTISNNTVGSTTTANSLNAATASTSTFNSQQLTGILSSSSTSATITGNTMANLNNNYAGTLTGSQIRGIVTTAGVNIITGNTVRNLSTSSQVTGLGASSSVLGISQTSTTAGQTVSQNIMHSLSNTGAPTGGKVTGIYYSGNVTTGPNVIARNLMHSFSVVSSNSLSGLRGMDFGSGTFTVQNNMVRIGLDASGASTGGGAGVYGIVDNNSDAGRNFYHNSIYLDGAQTSGSTSTTAFVSLGTGNTRAFQNNVFVNTRRNSGGNGLHYAVRYSGTGANPAGLTASNNIFFVRAGSALGLYSTLAFTLTDWQSATGVDAASIVADPLFINPTGTATTVDLHVQPGSPANNGGTPIAGLTTDFDGQARSATLPDIGADEFISNNANLNALALTSGALSPTFAAGTTSYTTTVPNATATQTATPTLADSNATVTVNGAAVASGSASVAISLNPGTNTITVLVIAQDGTTTKPYTVSVTRNTVLQDWAAANGVAADPNALGANGLANLLNFAFGLNPGGTGSGTLVFNGTFGAGGTIGANGLPVTMLEPVANGVDFRALFIRRKDYVNAGLTYAVEFSAALATWAGSPSVPTVLADDGAYQIVSVPYPAFVGGKKARFFRVRVTLAP